jgi:hypothetical protein
MLMPVETLGRFARVVAGYHGMKVKKSSKRRVVSSPKSAMRMGAVDAGERFGRVASRVGVT